MSQWARKIEVEDCWALRARAMRKQKRTEGHWGLFLPYRRVQKRHRDPSGLLRTIMQKERALERHRGPRRARNVSRKEMISWSRRAAQCSIFVAFSLARVRERQLPASPIAPRL